MLKTLRVLIVEDSEADASMIVRELKRGEWEVAHERVDTLAAMSAALDKPGWNVIIADYSMPQFSGPAALALAIGRASDLPFILVSGVVSEETAVLATKAGADDYISKGNLARLVPAVKRELYTAHQRREAWRMEQESRQRATRLANALQLARIGTWHLDLKTNAAVWSDEACRIIGVKAVPAPAFEALLDQLHPTERALLMGPLRQSDTRQFAQDLQIIRTGGETQFVQIRGDIVRDSDSLPIEAAGTIQDITERKAVDHELAKAKQAAEAANRSKSEFLANMSHEIRTPMNAILGFAGMVVNKEQDKAGRIECARIIQRNALHLLELINEILDLSKIEARQMTVERIPCDLPAMLSEIVSVMHPRANEKGLAFDLAFEGPIPRLIQTDPMRLRQILVNLLGNAMKFTETGGINMRVTDAGTGGSNIVLRVDVIDSGIGMTPEQLERLFEPFTQGDDSITRKFGGTGLGLTISRRIAKLLNGDISVVSQYGAGSTFTLKCDGGPSAGVEMLHGLTEATLPAMATKETQAVISLRAHILLAEDGRDNQRLLRMQLCDAGATVVLAENGKIAVDLASTQSFDLILMDMQMPVMDGYAATEELRRKGLTLPIIALTAHAMEEDRAKCIASGCSDYLTKPIEEETLLKTISQHLGKESSPRPGADDPANPDSAGAAPPAAADMLGRIKSSLAGNARMMKIIPEFVAGLPAEVRKMTDLLERNDLAALQVVVHQLLGACGGYGFAAVSEPAMRAEAAIKAGNALESSNAEFKSLIEVIRRIEGYDESQAPTACEKPSDRL